MQLSSPDFQDQQAIPGEFAFGVVDPVNHITLSTNRNPALRWSGLPEATRSLVLICHDPDVPSSADDVNQEGRTVPADLPRMDFFHWVLVDLPPTPAEIHAGEFSEGIRGAEKQPQGPRGTRQGLNTYTLWFQGDPEMGANYFGYDGPCPPWNDSIVHRYVFSLYALDVERCPVEGEFDGEAVRNAIQGHVLAEASLTGLYSLNPAVPASP